jgi:ribosome-associated protein
MAKSRPRTPSPRPRRSGKAAGARRSAQPAAPAPSETLARRVAALCREKRAEDVVVLDVRGLADYMDFLVLATGLAERQNRAIADHVVRSVRGDKVRPLSVSGEDVGAWICVDFVDVVLHVFDRATRRHYDLELLWGDAPKLALGEPAAAAPPTVG